MHLDLRLLFVLNLIEPTLKNISPLRGLRFCDKLVGSSAFFWDGSCSGRLDLHVNVWLRCTKQMRTFHWILPVILPGAKVRVEFPNLTAGAEVPELVKEQVEVNLGQPTDVGTVEEL